MKVLPKKLLFILPASTLFLTACLEEALESLFRINANNAADVISAALDAKDSVSRAKDTIDAIGSTGSLSSYTIDCSDTILNPNATPDDGIDYGSVSVNGTFESPAGAANISLSYNSCLVQETTLNGSMNLMYSTTSGIKTGSFSGNLNADISSASGNVSLSLSNLVFDYTRDKTAGGTEPFTEDFGLDLAVPLMGTLNVNTPVGNLFEGDKIVDSNPNTGQMVVTAGGNTKARLTVVDIYSYDVDADTNGDGTYNATIGNYAW